jgi:hypothetical protein
MKTVGYIASMQSDDPSLTPADIIANYERCIAELQSAVAGMTRDQLIARPIAGKWSTLECVAHVADTEVYFSDRIERTIAMERPLLISVDERPYPERMNYQAFDLDEQLDLFRSLRRHVARILRMQPAEAWQRTAVHSETGLLNLRQLVLQATRHARHHIPFIAEKRKALGISS